MEAVLRRLCKNTENPNNQPANFVELFLFWNDDHEDTWRPHSWDVNSWMYTIPIPSVGCTDVDPCMDRCSCHSFGLLESGCSCVKPQSREEHSNMLQGAEDNFFTVIWNATTKICNLPVYTPDKIYGLWNYVIPVRIVCAVIIVYKQVYNLLWCETTWCSPVEYIFF